MIKMLNYIGRETVRSFTLEKSQPVKNPIFMLFPVKGTLEVKNLNGAPVVKRKMTVASYKELMIVIHQPLHKSRFLLTGKNTLGKNQFF